MFSNGFFVTSPYKYLSYDIISYHYDILHYATLHSSFCYLDDFDIPYLVEFDEFLYGFDEFGIDCYHLFSSLFSEKYEKCINMFDCRDIDPERYRIVSVKIGEVRTCDGSQLFDIWEEVTTKEDHWTRLD